MKGNLIENRIIVWDIGESKALFSDRYYGKPIGVAKPKPDEIDAPLILDLIEGYYLAGLSRIRVYRGSRRVTMEDLLEVCRREYHDFDKKYTVYKSFRDKGYVVNTGIKYGCDFAVYERGPGVDHAPYLVQVYSSRDSITTAGIVLAGRLAGTVRKQFIFAIPRARGIDFVALDWWKA